MIEHHKILFYQNPISKKHRAVCSCGWTLDDDNKQWVEERAAVHDLEQDENKDDAERRT
jgi:hypothetical protein